MITVIIHRLDSPTRSIRCLAENAGEEEIRACLADWCHRTLGRTYALFRVDSLREQRKGPFPTSCRFLAKDLVGSGLPVILTYRTVKGVNPDADYYAD